MKKTKISNIFTLFKLKLFKFIKEELLFYIIIFSSIALCSWLFDKWIEGIMLCISHTCIRNSFSKQFHFNSTAYCLMLTLAIIWFSIPITLPLELSLLSSIPICFLISYFGFIAQDRIDLIKEVKSLKQEVNKLLDKLNHKDIYAMNEQELYEHCRNCGLSDVECKIAYYVVIERLKGKELYDAINYSEAQAKRKRKKILNSIKN